MRPPALTHDSAAVFLGDCLDVLAEIPDNSIDAIICDPPYGLGFMGKAWDDLPPGLDWAVECLRVLKPGGHLLAFGGTRTWHRLAVAVEDAGFEVRDSIAWLYGSGFPKSLDVSKAIDKGSGKNRERQLQFTAWMRSTGISRAAIDEATGTNMGSHYLTDLTQPAIATADLFDRLRPLLPEVPEAIERLVAERTGIAWTDYVNRPVVGRDRKADLKDHVFFGDAAKAAEKGRAIGYGEWDITAPATPAAQQWAGWGTALKPAFEPIVVARKPLVGTVAANVLAYGTGALNIDATRVGDEVRVNAAAGNKPGGASLNMSAVGMPQDVEGRTATGRWPANVLLDGDAAAELDEQSVTSQGSGGRRTRERPASTDLGIVNDDGWEPKPVVQINHGDTGGASRFFPVFPDGPPSDTATEAPNGEPTLPTFRYQAKAPTRERPTVVAEDGTKTAHPTVKPLALMRWLVRLVTPPGGTVLDTFAGSGATVEAAIAEGFYAMGIEREESYLPLIQARLDRVQAPASNAEGAA